MKGMLAALRHRDFRYLMAAFTISDIGTWAYNIALAIWVIDATDSYTWLAATTVVRFVPALVFSPFAGLLADRFERRRLMMTADAAFAGLMVLMGTAMALDAPPAVVLVVAACSSTLGSLYGPAAAALTPHVVPEKDLASANTLRNTVDNLTVVLGPALGALLALTGPPQNAVWINAVTFVASFLLLARVHQRAPGADVTEGGEAGALRQVTAGLRAMRDEPGVLVLVGFSVLATGMFGADTVFFVAASDELLGTGPDGYGYLLAGLGVGGLLAAPLVTRAEALPRLAPVIVGGMAVYCLPTLVLLVSGEPAVAFAVQVLRGAGTLFVDVLAVTALQRALPSDVMARVFAVFDSLCLIAVLIGSTVTGWLVGAVELDAIVWTLGAGGFAISLLGLPWLLGIDRRAAVRRAELAPLLELLDTVELVEEVPDGGLVQLAGAGELVDVPTGQAVVTQGETADAFYVIVSGGCAVVSEVDGRRIDAPALAAGDWFGEIGLLEGVPRTATVTATEPTRVLRLPGEEFLAALTAGRPTAAFTEQAGIRLRRTHGTGYTGAALRP